MSEYARLIRYTPHMPLPNILSLFFPNQNLLVIDKEHWDRLDDYQRSRVLRTQEKTLEIYYPPNKPPVVTSKVKEDA